MELASEFGQRIERVVDIPLTALERTFKELAAGMTNAGDHAEGLAELAEGDERFAQIIMMVHSRGLSTGLDLAAASVAKTREAIHEAIAEQS